LKSNFRILMPAVLIVILLSVAGCGGKKTPPASTYSTAPTVAAPTAHISANPTTILAGDSVELSWNTTNANTVNIDGIGDVPSSGKRTISPAESTTYRVVARGDGGTGEDTVRVTVNHPQRDDGSSSDIPALSAAEAALFRSNIEDAFFGYDAYKLDEAAQTVLAKDAAFLVQHTRYHIVIGGYCDERGSSEYNLALGQNRAESAMRALVAAGVAENRIRVVSYGKEKPFCTQSSEECWAKNRRAAFTIDTK
jgi:peptidoglycan-associated lipoprotein